MDDTVVVITGLLTPFYVENLIAQYKYTKHKIISTWNDQDIYLIFKLTISGFLIICNKYPELRSSANLQIICAHNGVERAIANGFKYICHARTDIFPLNFNKFLTATRHIYTEGLMVPCGIDNGLIYYVQLLITGPAEEMRKLYSKLEATDTKFPEKFLIENYAGRPIDTREDVLSVFRTFLDICKKENIEFLWARPPEWFIGERSNPLMRLIGEYCAEDAMFV